MKLGVHGSLFIFCVVYFICGSYGAILKEPSLKYDELDPSIKQKFLNEIFGTKPTTVIKEYYDDKDGVTNDPYDNDIKDTESPFNNDFDAFDYETQTETTTEKQEVYSREKEMKFLDYIAGMMHMMQLPTTVRTSSAFPFPWEEIEERINIREKGAPINRLKKKANRYKVWFDSLGKNKE